VARIAAASVALASVTALAVAGVAERASVADSFTVLGHLSAIRYRPDNNGATSDARGGRHASCPR
jgi:hypothetical protein